MIRMPAGLALVALALALAGCGSVQASAPHVSAATPSLPCSLPYGTQVALISPVPGSSTSGNRPIVLAASRELPKTITLIATDRRGGVTQVATLERLAPQSHAHPNPPFPDPIYYKAIGNALHSHRHYTLALDDLAQNGCAPYAAVTGEARFST
jgi:hypothetical protein